MATAHKRVLRPGKAAAPPRGNQSVRRSVTPVVQKAAGPLRGSAPGMGDMDMGKGILLWFLGIPIPIIILLLLIF
jgi:hypothetical protein